MAVPLLVADDVEIRLGDRRMFGNLDLRMEAGDRIGVTGRSGLGKTLLVDSIMRVAVNESSSYLARGVLEVRARKIGYLPQASGLLRWFTVGDLIERALKCSPGDRRSDTEALLDAIGVRELWHAFPRTLSGGEVQRVGLGLALVLADELAILDEPLMALDIASRIDVMRSALDYIRRHGISLFLISHDLDMLLAMTTKIHVLKRTGAGIVLPVAPAADSFDPFDPSVINGRKQLIAELNRADVVQATNGAI